MNFLKLNFSEILSFKACSGGLSSWIRQMLVGLLCRLSRHLGEVRQRSCQQTTRRCLVFPPTGPGSVGDQAMLVALVSQLEKQGFTQLTFIAYHKEPEWGPLLGGYPEISLHGYWPSGRVLGVWGLLNKTRGIDSVYFVGADIMDGRYNELSTCLRIETLKILFQAGLDVNIIGFSFNKDPSQSCVDALAKLPKGILLKARDPVSRVRLETFTGRKIAQVADVAFLLNPTHDTENVRMVKTWIVEQRRLGRRLLGLNLCSHMLTLKEGITIEQLLGKYLNDVVAIMQKENVSIVGIAHDSRGEMNDGVLLEILAKALSEDLRENFLLMSPQSTSGEIKAICGDLDLVFSGRMHLAIASLGAGTPVGCIVYQGKFEGLFKLFHVTGAMIAPEDFMAECQPRFLLNLLERSSELRDTVREHLPEVEKLAKANFSKI